MNDLDSALRATYQARSQAIEPPSLREEVLAIPDLGIGQQRRWPSVPTPRLQSMFSATKLVVAGAIVALFGGFLLAGVLTGPSSDDPAPGVSATASPSLEASYVVTEVLRPGSGGGPYVATADALWRPNSEGGVSRIDAATGETTTTEPFLSEFERLLVPTEDAIWAVEPSSVHRIDPTDLEVTDSISRSGDQPFTVGVDCGPPIIADGSLWITAPGVESSTVVEIDLATRSIRDEYVAEEIWGSEGSCTWMGAIDDDIWVHSRDPEAGAYRLTRFDLGARAFTDRVADIPGTETWPWVCCVADEDAIWIIDQADISRFDVATLEVTDTLDLGGELRGGIAAGGALWVVRDPSASSRAKGSVYRIDPETREVTDILAVGFRPEPPAFLHGAIWVANHLGEDRTISRIDVDAREVTEAVRLADEHQHAHTPLGSVGVIWVRTQDGYLLRLDAVVTTE